MSRKRDSSTVLHLAGPDAAEAMADVYLRARAGMTFLPPSRFTEAHTRHWLADVAATQVVLLAEQAGLVVGFATLADGWLTNLYVDPAFQNQGIGTALVRAAQTMAPDGLRLWVFEPNRGAIRFYERHGFVEQLRTDGRDNDEQVPDRQMLWQPEAEPG